MENILNLILKAVSTAWKVKKNEEAGKKLDR